MIFSTLTKSSSKQEECFLLSTLKNIHRVDLYRKRNCVESSMRENLSSFSLKKESTEKIETHNERHRSRDRTIERERNESFW